MERKLIELLRHRSLTMATAESCTGGNIAHRITLVPGASDVFSGAVVSYSNRVKADILGVSMENLRLYGAVSEPVVREMAEGVCRALGVDCAVATSGIAGPGGGTPDKPVGMVWMAVHVRGFQTQSAVYRFDGDRATVIETATTAALKMLQDRLVAVFSNPGVQ